MAQSALFEDIQFYSRNDEKVEMLSRTITERPELGALIRKISLQAKSSFGMRGHPIFRQIHLFTALRDISFIYFKINTNPSFALNSLPSRLDSITFVDCEVTPRNESAAEIIHSTGVPTTTPLGLKSLRVVTINPGPLFTQMILSDLMAHGHHRGLTTLRVNAAPAILIHFLISTPQLRRIWLGPFEDDNLYATPPDAVPLLEDFSGPMEYGELFLRGRPVHTIDITVRIPGKVPVGFLDLLATPSVALTKLTLSFDLRMGGGEGTLYDNHGRTILSHAPITLRHLCLNNENIREDALKDAIAWIPILSRFTELQTVHGFIPNQIQHQKDTVQVISDLCPSVREIATKSTQDRWVRGNDGHWEWYTKEWSTWA